MPAFSITYCTKKNEIVTRLQLSLYRKQKLCTCSCWAIALAITNFDNRMH